HEVSPHRNGGRTACLGHVKLVENNPERLAGAREVWDPHRQVVYQGWPPWFTWTERYRRGSSRATLRPTPGSTHLNRGGASHVGGSVPSGRRNTGVNRTGRLNTMQIEPNDSPFEQVRALSDGVDGPCSWGSCLGEVHNLSRVARAHGAVARASRAVEQPAAPVRGYLAWRSGRPLAVARDAAGATSLR